MIGICQKKQYTKILLHGLNEIKHNLKKQHTNVVKMGAPNQ